MGLSASGVLQLSLGVFISLAVQGNAGGAVLLGGPSSRAGSDPLLLLRRAEAEIGANAAKAPCCLHRGLLSASRLS